MLTDEDRDWVKYLYEEDPETKKKRKSYAVAYKKTSTLDKSEQDTNAYLMFGPKTLPDVVKAFQYLKSEHDFWAEKGKDATFFDDYCKTSHLVAVVDPRKKDHWH